MKVWCDNFGVIFWNFIFENFGGGREVGGARLVVLRC